MKQADIRLRGETVADQDAIEEVVCRAFESMEEVYLIRYVRDLYPTFDRRYSITAWDGENLVGHTLFTPVNMRLMGNTVRALLVGPVAVVPHRQRQGIGRRMIDYGHDIGRRDGFALTFLQGIPAYYPRLGYYPCYGAAEAVIDVEKLPEPGHKFVRLPVHQADLPWLSERYLVEHGDVDFAVLRGTTLEEWTLPIADATMWWTEDGRRAAYTLSKSTGDWTRKYILILADDLALARDVIAAAKPASLEHHPSGWLARNVLDREWARCEVTVRDSHMAYQLQDGALKPYLDAVQAQKRPPGACLNPLPFLL